MSNDSDYWIIGACINIVGSILINVGTNLIKYHHNVQQQHLQYPQYGGKNGITASVSSMPQSTLAHMHVLNGSSPELHLALHHKQLQSEPTLLQRSTSPSSTNTKEDCSISTDDFRACHNRICKNGNFCTDEGNNNLLKNIAIESSASFGSPIFGSGASPHTHVLSTSNFSVPHSTAINKSSNVKGSNSSRCCLLCYFRRSKWWTLGFLLFLFGNLMNFVSFAFAAQSLLAGLGSIQFISNIFCMIFVLKQKLTNRIIMATLAIVAGNSLIVAFASHQSTQLSVEDLWDLYTKTAYKIYVTLLLLLLLALYVLYKEAKSRLKKACMMRVKPALLWTRMLPCAYAAVSAIVGTQSVLLAKSCSELLRSTIAGSNQFIYPFTYFIIAAWISTMVFWLYRMNDALRKFDGVFIIPVLQVVWTIFSIVGGGIYFQEFNSFSMMQISLFTIGVAIVVGGVFLLAPQPNGKLGNSLQILDQNTRSGLKCFANAMSSQRMTISSIALNENKIPGYTLFYGKHFQENAGTACKDNIQPPFIVKRNNHELTDVRTLDEFNISTSDHALEKAVLDTHRDNPSNGATQNVTDKSCTGDLTIDELVTISFSPPLAPQSLNNGMDDRPPLYAVNQASFHSRTPSKPVAQRSRGYSLGFVLPLVDNENNETDDDAEFDFDHIFLTGTVESSGPK